MYSDWMAVPRSVKTTSVKPSGTVSLFAGSTRDYIILRVVFTLGE